MSYKPQYLEAEAMLVSEAIKDAMKYKTQLIEPLGLSHLMNKQTDQLSGGELQRVAIARCLGQDADLYLLDEPSAYLDVEQRLRVSKIIRDFVEKEEKAAFVVDHDLLFLDYLSHKLMVFQGAPGKEGTAEGPFPMEEGMTRFLKELGITMRRDPESNRPRINKLDSAKDREQKKSGKYYYS